MDQRDLRLSAARQTHAFCHRRRRRVFGLYFGIRFVASMILFRHLCLCGHRGVRRRSRDVAAVADGRKAGEISFIEIIGSTVAFLLLYGSGFSKTAKKPAWERVGFARDTGFVRFRPVLIPLLIVLGFSLNMFVSLAFDILPIPEDVMNDYADKSSMLGETTMLSVLATAIFAPLSEELIFRGMMISRLRRALPAWAAALIPSVIFGLIHGQIIWMFGALSGLFSAISVSAHVRRRRARCFTPRSTARAFFCRCCRYPTTRPRRSCMSFSPCRASSAPC